MNSALPPTVIGVSLKMYLDHVRTVEWCREIARIATEHEAITSGATKVVVLPTFPSLPEVVEILAGTPVGVGAQDLFWEDSGAYTGAVSGVTLRQVGCEFVEIGHAERKRLFSEDGAAIARKVAAAFRNELIPIICVGEHVECETPRAAEECVATLEGALALAGSSRSPRRVVVAYEPEWAIGAEESASSDHIRGVAVQIREWLVSHGWEGSSHVIYGGSAGPGLLNSLHGDIDGLFLGRFAHDPKELRRVLDETTGAARTLALGVD